MSSLLLPAENLALTVARAQVERRDNPAPNVSAVLVMALDRLISEILDGDLYQKCGSCAPYDECDCRNGYVKVERGNP